MLVKSEDDSKHESEFSISDPFCLNCHVVDMGPFLLIFTLSIASATTVFFCLVTLTRYAAKGTSFLHTPNQSTTSGPTINSSRERLSEFESIAFYNSNSSYGTEIFTAVFTQL